jgi:chromate transporter
MDQSTKIKKIKLFMYLLDVLTLAVTAFGGPQMHFTQFYKTLVKKRNYLTEEELKELNSLCSMLPGPTSTQTITAIGYKLGGPLLAFATLAIWVLPASLIMLSFALLLTVLDISSPKLGFLKYLQPMAVGFIFYAAYQIKNIFITRLHHWVLMIIAAVLAIVIHTPYVFPLLLLLGGVVSARVNRANYSDVKPIRNISWTNFLVFLGVFLLAALLGALTKNPAVLIFENTYRYGSIVFGGGHVLIPMMYNQFVEFKHYLEPNTFLAGIGVLQAVPGPVFSFSTYTGAMALTHWGIGGQILGGVIGTVAIFLPGILLIFFVYPIWAQIKNYSPIKHAIEGINATSAGLVIASAYLLFEPIEVNQANMLVLLGTLFLLLTTKIPSPVVVIICIWAGFAF